jgi:hypothetical protein
MPMGKHVDVDFITGLETKTVLVDYNTHTIAQVKVWVHF